MSCQNKPHLEENSLARVSMPVLRTAYSRVCFSPDAQIVHTFEHADSILDQSPSHCFFRLAVRLFKSLSPWIGSWLINCSTQLKEERYRKETLVALSLFHGQTQMDDLF